MDITTYRTEVQNLIQEIQENRGTNPDIILTNCNKLEAYGRKIQDDALVGFACFSRGEIYYISNDMTGFYREMINCIHPLECAGEWAYVVMSNNLLGIMSLNRGNAPIAMDYYLKAWDLCTKYNLSDLAWLVHMNIASLYLNVGDEKSALPHIEEGYKYITAHPDDPGFIDSLTVAYVDFGKAYLMMGAVDKSSEYAARLERECLPSLSSDDKLGVACFEARLYETMGEKELRNKCIISIEQLLRGNVPIMDIFDDIYEYLLMLLQIEKYEDFLKVYERAEALSSKTNVKNLSRKLLTLKLSYYKKTGDEEAYRDAAVLFYEVSQGLEREGRMALASAIALRKSVNDLTIQNLQVKNENRVLHRKSETDALTGIANRMRLNEFGEEAYERCYSSKTPLAIEILDIDYFKEYNDNYGHQSGDEAIRAVATCLQKLCKYKDLFCARYGGDEFVVIYEGYTEQEILAMSYELKKSLAECNIEHKFSKASDKLTISQGICWGVPQSHSKLWDFMHSADLMLYNVKKVSRDSVRLGYLESTVTSTK